MAKRKSLRVEPSLCKDRRVRLALIEDDEGFGAALQAALIARGYQIDRKRRGTDLLIAHRDYDAVILDLGLPDMDGLEVLHRLREVSSVPMLILTARGGERSIVHVLRSGADDYLVKPPRIAELVARLETVSRRRVVVRSETEESLVSEDVRVDWWHGRWRSRARRSCSPIKESHHRYSQSGDRSDREQTVSNETVNR
jgi:DNA-binding response OmpR family regulator